MSKSKDLFDETTMSFGEHLEILRVHLWKAIIGIVVCVIASLFFGKYVVAFVRGPVDDALKEYNLAQNDDLKQYEEWEFTGWLKSQFTGEEYPPPDPNKPTQEEKDELPKDTIIVRMHPSDMYKGLKKVAPKSVTDNAPAEDEHWIPVHVRADEFAQFKTAVEQQSKPVALNVQEAFLMYLKIAMVSGFVIASPWVFYQLWLFVAAGLYPHEKRYVYIYLPFSLFLFLGGALFCFYGVFPFILKFLFGFNKTLGVHPQIRLSEWISFAIMLPMMFGISFQLPLVMLFLERLSIFSADDYRSKRRMAILVIAVISMLLTPADPMSMLMMMFPLIFLYELGIMLCGMRPAAKSPFEEAPA